MPVWILLLAPAAGLVIDALLHAVLARLAPAAGPIRVQFVSFATGAVVAVVLLGALLAGSPFSTADRIGYFVLHLLIYGSLGSLFFNVISANVSSLRVRILKELLAQDPAPMDSGTLSARYSTRGLVLGRLARLESGGQIEARDGRYYLRKSGLALLAACFVGLRRLLLGTQP
jgi:hypothetical protein